MAAQHFTVRLANESDFIHLSTIVAEIENSSRVPGTGICKRSHEQLEERIREGNAVIALAGNGEWAGFCYIHPWSHHRFVSTCALVVSPRYRRCNVATRVKEKAFALACKKYPHSSLFGLTTSLAVMKINSGLGFRPVTYAELPQEDTFWAACKTCPHHDVLLRKNRRQCLCTALLFNPLESGAAAGTGRAKNLSQKDETTLQKKMQNLQPV